MPHRNAIDLLFGRHRCPACGKAAGFRKDFSGQSKALRWYQVAPVRQYCNSCSTQVHGVVQTQAWVAMTLWVILAGGAIIGAIENNFVTSTVGQTALLVAYLAVGTAIFQLHLKYEVSNHAP